MLHSRIDTTNISLTALTREHRMEAVRDFSWSTSSVLSYQAPEAAQLQGKAHTGFEAVWAVLDRPRQHPSCHVKNRSYAGD